MSEIVKSTILLLGFLVISLSCKNRPTRVYEITYINGDIDTVPYNGKLRLVAPRISGVCCVANEHGIILGGVRKIRELKDE